MPLYDYECLGCGYRFERRQGFDADPVEVCPRCQGQAHRRFHSVAVIYKGSGFYTTDYARKSYIGPDTSTDGASPPSTSSTSTSDASADETKTDKPEEVKTSEV